MDYIREAAFELRMSQRQLAKTLEVSEQALRNYRMGKQSLPVKLCVQIEQMTGGKITRKQLRQDWAELWPELGA